MGFLINADLLNVYFILHYHLFFRKEIYFFDCLYSVNTIFECLYMFFDRERDHRLSKYATVRTNHRRQGDLSVQKLGPFFQS